MKYQSFLLAGAAVAAIGILTPMQPVQADPYIVTTSVPAPTPGYTMGGYMTQHGGILMQLEDGAGNIVGASTPLPIQCISGCSGGTGGGGGTVTQGPGGTNTSPWFVSPGTSTFPVSGAVTVTGSVGLTGTSPVSGSVTALQGAGGTNTSPWFVSPGTSTFPVSISGTQTNVVSGTVTALPSGTQTVAPTGTQTIAGAVSQGAAGTNTAPWFVSPGTSTFPVSISGTQTNVVSGTVAVSGTSTIVCASGCSGGTGGGGTVTQGPQGTNTSPWFVSPGTSTFPVSGAVTVSGTTTSVPSGTQPVSGTVALSGTSTVVQVAGAVVAQGAAGTNTAPWFVSPGTSTFPVSGTVTAVPSGTQTVVQSGPLLGTSTVVQVNGATVGITGTATTTEPNVNANAGSASTQDVNIQQIGAASINVGIATCGTVATVVAASRATRQTITVENMGTGTVFIGGTAVTTSAGMLLPPLQGASITLPTGAAVDCIAPVAQTVSFDETF